MATDLFVAAKNNSIINTKAENSSGIKVRYLGIIPKLKDR